MHYVPSKAVSAGIAFALIGVTVLGVTVLHHSQGSPDSQPHQITQVTTMEAGKDEVTTQQDPFGVKKIYPTRTGGMVWYSDWAHGVSDPWIKRIGDARYTADQETGVLKLAGNTMRMYIREPHEQRQWTGDLEVTVYARKVPGQAENAPPYSGIVSDVRTNHGTVGNVEIDPCDSRGLFARLRFDGTADFGKEVRHPRTVPRREVRVWDDHMPEGEWIGYKQVVYTRDDAVVQELWVDFPGEGQQWVKVNHNVDRGGGWGKGERPCAPGIDPAAPLYGGTTRAGSESGLPNLSVLFRADELGPDGGLEYRWASVRQVEVPR